MIELFVEFKYKAIDVILRGLFTILYYYAYIFKEVFTNMSYNTILAISFDC